MSAAPRVLGFDPGTVTTDMCVLEGGRLAHAASLRTAELAADPRLLVDAISPLGRFDLVAAPSGYGLPMIRAEELDDRRLRLAFLAPPGETAGILGLRRAVTALIEAGLPLVFLPGVVQLATVPVHRKVNRVDMGTADKLCAAALAIAEHSLRRGVPPAEASLIVVEMGSAFTAALAVEGGAIVDGLGGSSGPLGFRAVGALDGEAAALSERVPKDTLFTGGVAWISGEPALDPVEWEARTARPSSEVPERERMAREAYLEGIVKAVAALETSAPSAREVILSGRLARLPRLAAELAERLARVAGGFVTQRPGAGLTAAPLPGVEVPAELSLEAALGAALIADGLCGGSHAGLVAALRLGEAAGTVLDHLHWPPARAGAERFSNSLP